MVEVILLTGEEVARGQGWALWPKNKGKTRLEACDRVSQQEVEQPRAQQPHRHPPTPMSTATRPTKTYGKKHSLKHGAASKVSPSEVITPEPTSTSSNSLSGSQRPAKRRAGAESSDDDESSQYSLSWLQKRLKSNNVCKCEPLPLSSFSLLNWFSRSKCNDGTLFCP